MSSPDRTPARYAEAATTAGGCRRLRADSREVTSTAHAPSTSTVQSLARNGSTPNGSGGGGWGGGEQPPRPHSDVHELGVVPDRVAELRPHAGELHPADACPAAPVHGAEHE